jgi:hypothetical protein
MGRSEGRRDEFEKISPLVASDPTVEDASVLDGTDDDFDDDDGPKFTTAPMSRTTDAMMLKEIKIIHLY